MEVDSNHRHQLWSFEEKGYNTYSIRLASEQELFLGISDFGKEQSGIVLVRDAFKYLWKIVGCPDLWLIVEKQYYTITVRLLKNRFLRLFSSCDPWSNVFPGREFNFDLIDPFFTSVEQSQFIPMTLSQMAAPFIFKIVLAYF